MSADDQQNQAHDGTPPGGRFGALWKLAAWAVGASVAQFFAPPAGTESLSRLVQVIAAVIVGVPIYALSSRRTKATVRRWWLASCACLVVGLATFVPYSYVRDLWTVTYYGTAETKGSTYTNDALALLKKQPMSDAELLKWLRPAKVDAWTPESTARNRTILLLLYSIGAPAFACCMLCAVHAANPRAARTSTRRKPGSKQASNATAPAGPDRSSDLTNNAPPSAP